MNSGSFCALFCQPFVAVAPVWQPFGAVMELFWLAFSAYAGLELQREPFQHHFDDLVSFLVPRLRIFYNFAKNVHNAWRSFGSFCASFFSILSIRACERSEAERVRCVVEATPQAQPEDHFGGIFCSSFVGEY